MAATTSQSHLLRPTLPSLRLRCPSSLHSVSLRRTNGTDRISSLRAVSKPTILVAEKLGAAGLELLKEFGNVDCSYNMSPEELCAKVPLCDALIVRSGTKVPAFLSFLFLYNTFCWFWQAWYAQISPLTNKFVLDCEMWAFNFAKEFHYWFDFFPEHFLTFSKHHCSLEMHIIFRNYSIVDEYFV